MVMSQSLIKQLVAAGNVVDVLAPAWSLPVVERMPEVREGIASQTGHGQVAFSARRRVARRLRAKAYDRAIVLPRSFKAALIPWLARIPVRTGFRGEFRYGLINDMRPFDASELNQTLKRYLALGEPCDSSVEWPGLRVSERNQRALLERLALRLSRPVVGLMPGAEYGPAKCWPLEYFTELAATLHASGYTVWVFGSEKDAAAGERIAASGNAMNVCGKTRLADVIDLLALCGQVVSNDSGLMHVAAAVGCHVHAIYGSSSPSFTPPLTASRTIHHLDLDCSPCFERRCPLTHLNCLRQISVQDVYAQICANSP